MKPIKKLKGAFLPVIMLASTLFLAFAIAIISLALSNVKIANLHNQKITAMSIAEAGINYYLWHLSHNNTDYCDGNTCTGQSPYGPFHHEYKDQNGQSLGTYDLYVTPPSTNSNITTVKSIGKVNGKSPIRTIIATLGMPSFTNYTLLTNNSELRIGSGEKIDGSIFVNHSGLKNDGEITGDAFSTESTYYSQFFNQTLPGINGSGIFDGSKLFPVPPIDFNRLGVDINILRDNAKNGGGGYYNASSDQGYHIILKNSRYDLYLVTRYNNTGYNITQERPLGTHDYPASGIIFAEDNLWVEGKIDTQKITLVAADPEAGVNQRKMIIIPSNVLYTNYDGRDKIGLISQTNIFVTRNALSNLEIDSAMIAKDGQIKINQYPYEHKGNIKVYGSMAHNTGLVWTYDYGGGLWSGYQTTQTVMDQSNILNPPPFFPLTGSYNILSWREE